MAESLAAFQVKFLRGTGPANDAYTGPVGEMTVDLTNWRIRLHDGTTAGGHPISNLADLTALETIVNALSTQDIAGMDDYATEVETQAMVDAGIQLLREEFDIVDSLTSNATDKPLSAAQGAALKNHIDNINALLASDTTTLDELQEIVDYIKVNRTELENLSISSIAGLQTALDAKVDTTGDYGDLRARGTTRADVGLSNVRNVASYSQTEVDDRFLPQQGAIDMGFLP